jgi:hypothetical protein
LNDTITINGEKFSLGDLMLLTGEDEVKEPKAIYSSWPEHCATP